MVGHRILGCCSRSCLMDGAVVGYGQGDLSFLCLHLHHHHHTSPFPSHYLLCLSSLYLSAFDSSSHFFCPQRCLFLISSLLFYSFFHFLSHLFCLTLTVYPDCLTLSPLLPLHFYRLSAAPPHLNNPPHPLFTQTRSPLWTLQLCCSAFRRREYLQFCMFENLWWARDSHLCSSVRVCTTFMAVCKCMHVDFFVYWCVRVCAYLCVYVAGLCRVILIILTSQCPILGEREVRDGGGRGVRERKGRRDVLPPWQTPFI